MTNVDAGFKPVSAIFFAQEFAQLYYYSLESGIILFIITINIKLWLIDYHAIV